MKRRQSILILFMLSNFFSALSMAELKKEVSSTSDPIALNEENKSSQGNEIENDLLDEKTSELPAILNDMLPQSPDFLNNLLHLQFFEEDFKTSFHYELSNNILTMSGYEISINNFNFNLDKDTLNLNWPQLLFTKGSIEIIDAKGILISAMIGRHKI